MLIQHKHERQNDDNHPLKILFVPEVRPGWAPSPPVKHKLVLTFCSFDVEEYDDD